MQDGESDENDLPRAPSRGDLVLIADPSAEGESVAAALRAHGFSVIDAPLALLEARVLGEPPKVLIIDLGQPGALEALERLREGAGLSGAELICIGDTARAAELGVPSSSGRTFSRPIDLDQLIATVAEIATPAPRDHSVRGTTPPPSFAPRRETSPPVAFDHDAEAAPPSDYPPAVEGLDAASILPHPDDAGVPRFSQAEFSPHLERILNDAALRVNAEPGPLSLPSPEQEVDLVLSPELLASLDEPIDPDEEDLGTGSGLGTGAPIAQGGEASRGGTASGAAPQPATDAGGRIDVGAELAPATGPGDMSGTNAGAFGHTPVPPSHTAMEAPVAELFEEARSPSLPERSDFVESPSAMALSRAFGEPIAPRGTAIERAPTATSVARPPDLMTPPPPQTATSTITGMDAALIGAARHTGEIPAVLGEGDAVRALARAIAARVTGSLAMNTERGLRRIVLQDGDVLTAGSGIGDETLLSFLAARGDIERDGAAKLAGKLPPFGRHAGAALIAHGHLGQDDLWPVLRAHAEWIIGRAVVENAGTCELEAEPPGRFKAEPSVFGGATGAEVFVETLRRVIPSEVAMRRLGGTLGRLDDGPRRSLLGECALRPEEEEAVRRAPGKTVGDVVRSGDAELVTVVYACVSLEVLNVLAAPVRAEPKRAGVDPLDEEAIRARVRARAALVDDGDYFALLGVSRGATSYEIRRAYLELRRTLEPSRLLTVATADLAPELRLVVEVLDEAYEILKEPHRRERYRRAIEAGPP